MNRRKFLTGTLAIGLSSLGIAKAEAAEPKYTWITVDDMHCSHCAKKIARKLYTVSGVVKVQSDVSKNLSVVTPQEGKLPSPRALWEAVEAADFKPVKLQGPQGIFTSKPSI